MMKETKITKEKVITKKIVLRLVLAFVLMSGLFLLINSLKADCTVNPPMVSNCERYNVDELDNCVREGYTGTGFLGMTDWDTIYYVCEGYGRVAERCISYGESSPSNLTSDWEHCK